LDGSTRKRSALGFLQDDRNLDKLGRYETRLENRLHRLLRELERLQAQRVEGEIVAKMDADPAISDVVCK